MNGAAAGQMTDLKRGSPPLTTTKNRELLCYRTIIEYCEHVVSKNDRRDFIRHVNTRGHDRTDESSSKGSSPISELQIFIYEDLYIGQSTLACCRASAAIRGYFYMSLHI